MHRCPNGCWPSPGVDRDKVREAVRVHRPAVANVKGAGYYTGLCLRISTESEDGARFCRCRRNFTDWTAQLLQDKKERLTTSGMGTEFVCRRYRGRD
jgi:hypothetical protein